MNYYEHHIGDYAEATAHLTFVEDAAYSRMLRKYYASERPLPAEVRSVQRLVGARTKEEREAVEVVLAEFFTLQDDGWHQRRCDVTIAEFREKQGERQAEREAAAERQRRARERRAELFEALRGHGIVPSFKTPTHELEAQLSRVTSAAGHAVVTRDNSELVTRDKPDVTCDDTATQSPVPSPQSPDTSSVSNQPSVVVAAKPPRATRKAPPDFALTPDLEAWAAANAPHVNAEAETAKFRDHTFATARSDWPGTWRNWLRKAEEDAARRPAARVNGHDTEPEWRREQRERNEAFLGPFAAKRRKPATTIDTTDTEAFDAAPRLVG